MTIPNSEGLLLPECCLPPTPDEERETIAELTRAADANKKEGDVFCVISARWFRDWEEYVQMKKSNADIHEHLNGRLPDIPCRPGIIDNSELVSQGTSECADELTLRKNLQEGQHYLLVSEEVWKKLHEWYKGGPKLPRKFISEGIQVKSLIVEVYPLRLKLVGIRDSSARTITMSRKASVRDLYRVVCALLKLEQTKVDLWDFFEKKKHKLLNDFDETLQDSQLQMDQEILVDVKVDILPSISGMDSTGNELALVPMEPSRSRMSIAGGPTLSNGHSSGFRNHFLQENNVNSAVGDMCDDDGVSNGNKVDGQGLTGLHNLGNTCFMNSALQCLVHTPKLVRFFLQDYSKEINKNNPLGMQGELAIAFGDLLRKLWSSGRTSVAPRAFKAKLARFAPQFSGYNQHDSQELLAFLLDGLHEDLNRVINKPYIEAKDANGRSDEEFANECWENHKARNDSVIVDVCQGQYKSTLVCPVCSKVSVTFDPFMYLSLPLPSTTTRSVTVTVFSGDGSALPMPLTVMVPDNGSCVDLHRALIAECGISSSEDLLLAEVYDNYIYRYLNNSDSLYGIKNDDHLVAYRLPSNYKEFVKLEILHQRTERATKPTYNLFDQELHQKLDHKLVGTPLVTCLPYNAKTGSHIRTAIFNLLSPLLRVKTSSKVSKLNKENGFSSLDGVVPTDDPCSSDMDPNSLMEIEVEDDGLGFKLFVTDQKGSSRIPLDDAPNIFAGSCITIVLEWSEEDTEEYDFSFLENLPAVFKLSGYMAKKTRQEGVTLFSCLDAFSKEEPLGPDDMWYCPNCKEHRQALKKLDLWRLPEILVFHLKRFSYSRYLKNKLDTFVNFPVRNLDLSKYVKQNAAVAQQSHVYELYAVSNHYGGLGGGHYTAYAKLIEEDSWYHFDDSYVSPASEDSIKTSAAYVLFYRRVEADKQTGSGEGSSSGSGLSC